jgi:hypothetical protein
MKISLIGGGRWARTIASVLSGLPGRADDIVLHSPSNFAGLKTWVAQPQFAGRLRVENAWPMFGAGPDRPSAVIVANRVAEHFEAAYSALNAGIPVLVEKPVSVFAHEIEQLTDIARTQGTILAAANSAFLFARYFRAYAETTAAMRQGQSLWFIWTDGVADIVRNEAKSFDSAVTVFDDVLPQILPLIGELQFGDCVLDSIDVQRGGARLEIGLRSRQRPVVLVLARDDEGRQRRIEIATARDQAILHFANEPGMIDISGQQRNGDPLWDSAPRPLATMLTAFLAAVEGASLDRRLSPNLAKSSAMLASAIRARYVKHQTQWLDERLGAPLDASLLYALTELSGVRNNNFALISGVWSAINDRAGLEAFLSKSPFCQTPGDAR